jgi:hypothetical protein
MRGYGGIVLGKILNFKNLCIIFIFNIYFTEYSGILKMQQLSVITFDGVNKRINHIPWLMVNIHFVFLELINLLWKENNKQYFICLLLADNIMALTFSLTLFLFMSTEVFNDHTETYDADLLAYVNYPVI